MTTDPVPATDLFDEEFFALASECSVEAWLSFLGHRWSALILYHLAQGPKRFGALSACLPTVTPKVMTERLAELEHRRLIERANPARGAPYRLTPLGENLMPILNALEVWARGALPGVDKRD